MGYYIRYIVTDIREISITTLADAIKQIDPVYTLTAAQFENTYADFSYGDTLLGEIEINHPGDDIFDEDLSDLKELVGSSVTPEKQRVLETLHNAQCIVTVEAIWPGRDSEAVLAKIDPLWDWLFEHYAGLLQADNEGYYDYDGLILEENLKI
jgi:hypothetical protein